MKDTKCILIVDDDIAHRTMVRILLNQEYEIFEADDGSTAIEEVYKQNFDLILMDIRMTDVSGIEAMEVIKSFKPDLPIVMMTAYFSDEISRHHYNREIRLKGSPDCNDDGLFLRRNGRTDAGKRGFRLSRQTFRF